MIQDRPSPNHDDRPAGASVDCLILHHTGMASGAAAIERLCDPAAKVSSHYVVEEDGTVFRLVAEDRRAWHAGVSSWAGRQRLNDVSVGVEIVNPGHEFGLKPFPEAQIAAVIQLCLDIMRRHEIHPSRVLAHSDVAPRRKRDPGELFPWERLAAVRVGLWPDVEPRPRRSPRPNVIQAQRMLARWGYPCPETGVAGPDTMACIAAFQRRYRPWRVDGLFDAGCAERLASLLAMAEPKKAPVTKE